MILCDKLAITGIHFDGGYQKYLVVDASSVAKIPDGLSFTDAAPLLCAGT